jgi:hypothetical protein
MFRRLLPREVSFFDYFEEHAKLTIEACEAFLALAMSKDGQATMAARIKELEQQADVVTHKCVDDLNATFITPIDRTDILLLIQRLDDIIDAVDASTSRIVLYELTDLRPEMGQLASILVRAAKEIEVAVKCLRNLKNVDLIKEKLIAIHQLENEGDAALRVALVNLFKEEEHRPMLVIKWKEIFERLEKATDRCEELANIIEKVIIEAS